MRRNFLLLSLSALLATCLISGCTSPMGLNEKEKERQAARLWYEKHLRSLSYRPSMSVVGYEPVRVHGHRYDRGELSLNRQFQRWGKGSSEIPAPRIVMRNPARVTQRPSDQPAVMQLKPSPRQRVPEEVLF